MPRTSDRTGTGYQEESHVKTDDGLCPNVEDNENSTSIAGHAALPLPKNNQCRPRYERGYLSDMETPVQFAMIDNQRSPAAPGLVGQCPGCAKVVIAKCGTQRDWHWAHKGQRMCDPWWEPETPWHRAWKSYFPMEWQEVIQHDEASGEKHIADVRTAHGLVIEFQHSHLDPAERLAREKFHGNMVWVVDGTRLKRDRPRFSGGNHYYMPTPIPGVSAVHYPEDMFPKDWLQSQVLVLFDFGLERGEDRMLWGLFPGRVDGKALVGPLPRSKFVSMALEKPQILDAHGIVAVLAEHNRLSRENAAREAAAYAKRVRFYRYQRRRGHSRH